MKIRTILYGILLYLAFEAWVTFLSILEVANQNLYLTILEVIPWVMFVAVLMIAVLVVIVPWDWLEEGCKTSRPRIKRRSAFFCASPSLLP